MRFHLPLLFLLTVAVAHASDKVLVPSRTVTPFVRVFEGTRIDASEVRLTTSELKRVRRTSDESKNWDFVPGTGSHTVSREKYDQILELSGAVVEARVGDNAFGYGTAFHIGNGLFLTNQHVLSGSRENTTLCERFRVRSPLTGASYKCDAVILCNRQADYCLIRMKSGGLFNRGPDPAELPGLRLRSQKLNDANGTYAAIGNPGGLGIHFSEGLGVTRRFSGFISFFAPVHSGNSGGPLLNAAGEVIGVVHAQSTYGVTEGAYNLAVAIDFIERDVREKLGAEHPAAEYLSSLVLPE